MNPSIMEQIGIEISEDMQKQTIADIFKATGFDWNVEQRELYQKDSSNNTTLIPNLVGNYREGTDNLFGIVSKKDYKVVQNIEAFDFIDHLSDFTFDRIGTSPLGDKVFIIGKSDEKFYIDGKDDPVNMYITFIHGHGGNYGIRLIINPIRMFCTNQMNFMLNNAVNKFSIAHTGNIYHKLNNIQKAINESHVYAKELANEIQTLIAIPINEIQIDTILTNLFPIQDDSSKRAVSTVEMQREVIKNLYNTKDDISNYRGTAFGLVSAVSDYVSHRKPIRSTASFYENEYLRNLESMSLVEHTRKLIAA